MPSEVEATSLAELAADGVAVQALLDLSVRSLPVPVQRTVTIPDGALAVVADLDSYGD